MSKELDDYIKDHINNGYTLDELKAAVLSAGYTEDDFNKALRKPADNPPSRLKYQDLKNPDYDTSPQFRERGTYVFVGGWILLLLSWIDLMFYHSDLFYLLSPIGIFMITIGRIMVSTGQHKTNAFREIFYREKGYEYERSSDIPDDKYLPSVRRIAMVDKKYDRPLLPRTEKTMILKLTIIAALLIDLYVLYLFVVNLRMHADEPAFMMDILPYAVILSLVSIAILPFVWKIEHWAFQAEIVIAVMVCMICGKDFDFFLVLPYSLLVISFRVVCKKYFR